MHNNGANTIKLESLGSKNRGRFDYILIYKGSFINYGWGTTSDCLAVFLTCQIYSLDGIVEQWGNIFITVPSILDGN